MSEREKETQRERAMWNALHSIHLNVSEVMVIIHNFLCHQCSWKVATLPTVNEAALKDFISCQPYFGTEVACLMGCFAAWFGNFF